MWCKGLKGCEAVVDCVFNTLHLLVVSIGGKIRKKKGEFRVPTNASSYKRNFSVTFYCQWFQSIFTLLEVPRSTQFKKLFLFLKRYVDLIRGNAERLQ